MIERRVTVINSLGLHARAAARFVNTASRYHCRVLVAAGDRVMDGKSILGLLLLAAARGTELTISAEGPDAEAAVSALVALALRGFEES